MPDELVPQIERIVQLVQAFDIPAVSAEGYEADDVLGALVTRAATNGIDVVIVTSDGDAFQLIDPPCARPTCLPDLQPRAAMWYAGGEDR